MAPDDLQSRLASLPGVLSCTVDEEKVAVLLHPDVEPRLIKARAQAVCAEIGETRPLVVVNGRFPLGGGPATGAPSGVAAARSGWPAAVPAFLARRALPASVAVLSLFVLSAVVFAPGEPNGRKPLLEPKRSPSVALAPLQSDVPAGPAPRVVPAPATPSSGFVVPPIRESTAAVTAGPVLVGLPATGAGFFSATTGRAADLGPAVTPGSVGIASRVAPSSAASPAATPTEPGASETPQGPGTSTDPAPAPVAAPAPDTSRTSSPLPAASSSDEKPAKLSQRRRGRAPRKAAPAEPQPAGEDRNGGGHQTLVREPGPRTNPETPESVGTPERGEGSAKPGAAAERPDRAQNAERAHHGARPSKPEQTSAPAKGEHRGAGRSSDRGK